MRLRMDRMLGNPAPRRLLGNPHCRLCCVGQRRVGFQLREPAEQSAFSASLISYDANLHD